MTNIGPIMNRLAKRRVLIGVAVVAVIAIVGFARRRGTDGFDYSTVARCKVERGDLTVTVLQAGELSAKKSKQITNETDTTTKILDVVPDGAKVKKGDLLVELDVGEIQDRALSAESQLAQSEASLLSAEKELEIAEFKYKSDLETANLKVNVAKLDLEKYTEAEYPNQILKAEMGIQLAEEELRRAETKLENTQKLVAREFASQQDLETAQLEVRRLKNDVKSKSEDLRILQEYTNPKDLKQRQNDLANARADVENLMRTYESESQRRRSAIESKKTELGISRNRVERLHEQVTKGKIYSEYDGQVFYPDFGRRSDRVIEKGGQVYNRQQILEFPDLSEWVVKAGVPETIIERIRLGQKALVSIDAMPDVVLDALVDNIGVAPDRQRWYDPSGKTYTVTLNVTVPPNLDLRPGMSVMVDIIVDELKDVLYVPIQAVSARDDKRFVYQVRGKKLETLEVETGKFDENHIEILAGLQEGQELLLYAPVDKETRTTVRDRPLEKSRENGVRNGNQGGESTQKDSSNSTEPQREAAPTPQVSGGGAPDAEPAGGEASTENRARPPRPANWDSLSDEEKAKLRAQRRPRTERQENP